MRRPGAFWDFPDIAMPFPLTAPRAASPAADLFVKGGPGNNPPALGSAAVAGALKSLEQVPNNDGPGTLFRLEILLQAAALHLPFFTPAKLLPDGTLAPDPSFPDVKMTLPMLKFSIQQTAGTVVGNTVNDPRVTIYLDSWGAESIDDPARGGYAQPVKMELPFFFWDPDRR
jgi:hypothetical protein